MDDTLITLFVQKYNINRHLSLGREKQQIRQEFFLRRKYGDRYMVYQPGDQQCVLERRSSRSCSDLEWIGWEHSVEFKPHRISVLVHDPSLDADDILNDNAVDEADKFINDSSVPKHDDDDEVITKKDDLIPKTKYTFPRKRHVQKTWPQRWNSDRKTQVVDVDHFLPIPETLTGFKMKKSSSTDNLRNADSALGKLIKSTLTFKSDEDLSSLKQKVIMIINIRVCTSVVFSL